MEAYKCKKCGYESITSKYYCPTCRSSEFEKVDVPNSGTVYSYTTIHIAPPEYVDLAPYQVVLVELTEKLKVTGFMKERVKIGDQVMFKDVKDSAYMFERVG
ncbi:OB-fold domain-containing protein [Ornithinibacillus sp. BX22]|uniref:OB-fold domain-containing protein n=2 Tax=Ornithinibacillus TaxID=484508 RepID=A0A923L3J5_9BACI|nr:MULTISPECIES: OB-fold domain-containing protein [Ornithinibacillus]MBC5635761.1 OB-fold domain-containing protein [Ornithinibacillus hominis]MBS3679371.1 OB-fold domain-containing protein [Ornithinibacillus massiliensis]